MNHVILIISLITNILKASNQRIQKLFHHSPYPLSVLKSNKNNGIINTQPNTNYNFRIELL
jgi:hypothetical protein